MSVQVEKLEKNMAKLTIEVSTEELEKAIESAFQKNKNKISVPGFRKGKRMLWTSAGRISYPHRRLTLPRSRRESPSSLRRRWR